jgi:hypothetical protein
MRRYVAVLALLGAFAGQDVLLACGDKFFLVGRGDRFSRAYASLHPGSIVIYAGGESAMSKALGDGRLQKHFAKAGHRVTLARDSAALSRALESAGVDIVLASHAEVVDLLPRVAAATSKPALMTVEDGEKRAADAQPLQVTATLKSSDKINGFLAKIEGVMKKRSPTSAARRS